MVLIPVSTNLNARMLVPGQIQLDFIRGDRGQDFSRILDMANPSVKNIRAIGNILTLRSLFYNDNTGAYEIPIHEIDFNNLYSINRMWLCGCCPHLFFVTINGKPIYYKEILKNPSSTYDTELILIPRGIQKIMISELEDEKTFISQVWRNNTLIVKKRILKKGDKIIIDVEPNDKIKIIGRYSPQYKTKSTTNDMWLRNIFIENFNSSFEQRL
jgi:hypothetical protein